MRNDCTKRKLVRVLLCVNHSKRYPMLALLVDRNAPCCLVMEKSPMFLFAGKNDIPGSDVALDVVDMLDVGNETGLAGSAVAAGIARAQVVIFGEVELGGQAVSGGLVVLVNGSDLEVDVSRTVAAVVVSAGEDGRQTVGTVVAGVHSCPASEIWGNGRGVAVNSRLVGVPDVEESLGGSAAITGRLGQLDCSVEVETVEGRTVLADLGHIRSVGLERSVGLVVGTQNVFGRWRACRVLLPS